MAEQAAALGPEALRQIAEAVRRVQQMPADRQAYALPGRRYGNVVHVVEVTNAVADAQGLCSGNVVVYETGGGEVYTESAGEDCYILDVNLA